MDYVYKFKKIQQQQKKHKNCKYMKSDSLKKNMKCSCNLPQDNTRTEKKIDYKI